MATASLTSVVGPAQAATSSLASAFGPLPFPNGHPTVRPPITKAIDIWALGVTLYCFVFGRCPFIADTEFELFNIIPRKPLSFPDSVPGRETIDAGLKDLLSRLLEKDVFKRITLKEVKVQHLPYHAIFVSWICYNNSSKYHAYIFISIYR
jgi:serine/threonine protein kinase